MRPSGLRAETRSGPQITAKCRSISNAAISASDRSVRLLVAMHSPAPRAASRSSDSTTPS